MSRVVEAQVDLRDLEYSNPGYVAKLVDGGKRVDLYPVRDLGEAERVALEQRMASFAAEQVVEIEKE